MVTKRTPIKRATKTKITPQLVAQFIIAREICDAGQEKEWEEDGGRCREYLDLCRALD